MNGTRSQNTSVLFLILLFSLTPLSIAKTKQPIISQITIHGTDVFDLESNPKLNHFPYNTVNWLHINTHDEVIRHELLFKEGDTLDPFLIRETERNLRALPFISAARIARFPQRDGTVHLVVNTHDAWTTEPMINLGGLNKISDVETGFREKNFLGFGKTVQFLYKKGADFTERQYHYYDPQFLHSRWQLTGDLVNNEAGTSRSVNLTRPFFSATTKVSTVLSHSHEALLIDEFENNQSVSKYIQEKEVNEAGVGFKVGGSEHNVNRIGPRYRRENRTFTTIPETNLTRPVPASQHLQTTFLDVQSQHIDFIEMTHLEKMTRVEDLNLGPQFSASPGLSPRAFTGTHDVYELEASYQQNILFLDTHLLKTQIQYKGRDITKNPENQIYSFNFKYYFRPSPFQTLVANNQIQYGDNLDSDNLIKLGGDTGLRAFKRDESIGTRSFLFNLEDRFYFADDAFNLFSLGGAAFYDTGYAWQKGEPVAISDMLNSIGTGLRLGLTRSSNEVIVRLDVSYRLNRQNTNDGRWIVSFGSSQAF